MADNKHEAICRMIDASQPPDRVTVANRIDGATVVDCGDYTCVFDRYEDAVDAALAAADYYKVEVVRVVLAWTRMIDGTILELPQSVRHLRSAPIHSSLLSDRSN